MSPHDENISAREHNDALAVQSESSMPTTPGPPAISHSADEQTRNIGIVNAASRGLLDKLPKQLGSYRILGPLGKGGMGEVLDAWDDLLDRPVAIKIIASRYADDPTLYRRLQVEARAAARLSHNNIVTVYQLGEDGMIAYIAMEKLEGESLSHVLKERGRLTPKEAAQMVRGVVEALAYAAERSVIHRDIKPGNLMVTSGGTVKVLDFGLAKRLDTDDPGLTATNCHVGTPLYMSPEQAAGDLCDHRTDIYALGITLYQMVVGHPPFQAGSPVAIAMKHATTPLPITDEFKTPGGEEFASILHRMTAKEAKNRYATYGELLADIDAFLADRRIANAPPARTGPGPKQSRMTMLIAASMVVVIAIAWATSRTHLPAAQAAGDAVLRPTDVPIASKSAGTDGLTDVAQGGTEIQNLDSNREATPPLGGPRRPGRGPGGTRLGPLGGSGRPGEQGPVREILRSIKRTQDGRDEIRELCLQGKLDEAVRLLKDASKDSANAGPVQRTLIEDMLHSLSAPLHFAEDHFAETQTPEERVATAILLTKVEDGPTRFNAIMYLLACSPEDGEAAWEQYQLDSPNDAGRESKAGPVNLLRVMHESLVPTE